MFLVDPAGGRYVLESPAPGFLVGWSADGTKALFLDEPAVGVRSAGVTVETLRNRTRTHVDAATAATGSGITGPQVAGAIFATPRGDGLLLTLGASAAKGGYLVRTDLAGRDRVVIERGSDGVSNVLSSPDGARIYLPGAQNTDLIRVSGNTGAQQASLHVPGAINCLPSRFLNAATLLVTCQPGNYAGLADGLWSVPIDGEAATMLTTKDPAAMDSGDFDAMMLGRTTYVETAGSGCGVFYISELAGDGTTSPLTIPRAAQGSSLVGTDGAQRLAVQTSTDCGTGSSLLWFNPHSNAEQVLLGPGANGGGVIEALQFGTKPAV